MSELDCARMETAMNDFVDAYFNARPQLLRSIHEVRLVEAGFKSAWNKRDKEIAALRQQPEEAQSSNATLLDSLRRMREREDGSVWYWQDDGNDNPESITCQIIVRPGRFRELLAAEQRLADAEGQEPVAWTAREWLGERNIRGVTKPHPSFPLPLYLRPIPPATDERVKELQQFLARFDNFDPICGTFNFAPTVEEIHEKAEECRAALAASKGEK